MPRTSLWRAYPWSGDDNTVRRRTRPDKYDFFANVPVQPLSPIVSASTSVRYSSQWRPFAARDKGNNNANLSATRNKIIKHHQYVLGLLEERAVWFSCCQLLFISIYKEVSAICGPSNCYLRFMPHPSDVQEAESSLTCCARVLRLDYDIHASSAQIPRRIPTRLISTACHIFILIRVIDMCDTRVFFVSIFVFIPRAWGRPLVSFPCTPPYLQSYTPLIYFLITSTPPFFGLPFLLHPDFSPLLLYLWPRIYRRRFFFRRVQIIPIYSDSFSRLYPLLLDFLPYVRS